jgi:hypothetical protein
MCVYCRILRPPRCSGTGSNLGARASVSSSRPATRVAITRSARRQRVHDAVPSGAMKYDIESTAATLPRFRKLTGGGLVYAIPDGCFPFSAGPRPQEKGDGLTHAGPHELESPTGLPIRIEPYRLPDRRQEENDYLGRRSLTGFCERRG